MADKPATYRDIIRYEAEQAGIPPELAFAVVAQESGGRGDAVGPDTKYGNARGFFQLIPPTAQGLGVDTSGVKG
jgi:soluble lytic murein transglycosylase-like protein